MPEIVVNADLGDGEMIGIEEEGKHVLLTRIAGEYFAMSDICSHARVLLSKGKLKGVSVTCPLHGARFDVRSGRCLSGPPKMDIETYRVSREDDRIIISVSDG
ncbi:MAG: non-heme iron oxygenase ferredoxin subunit [Pseudomonadales bacterium]|nr:non-heme iron oxygenase ferredoxin subunit [Pseudomonadales bacterium]MBO6566217.1 non-heme iron oxygenase ferredoxin subunit [Pseudomonadales bacterium]MBO6595458.1 non-heme iron oxygenase ferredoxin subunit [Pseudomonadales bacterium]MBO6657539.1 non-heme iron oxygenase ferredoxin subunit [Pseudomonadales bacterium]MBO6701958.1 non-heme iron oxygenase ferredoxin subunit [Pseudomonadales bacterium]